MRPIRAHYRLNGNGEHDPGCRYSFDDRAADIVKDSRGTVVTGADHYDLRIPQDWAEPVTGEHEPETSGQPRTRLDVTNSKRTFNPLLGSAARIVQLIDQFENDPDAASRFRAIFGGVRIPWNEFCHSTSDLTSLYDFVSQSTARKHPIAIHGTIGDVKAIKAPTTRMRDAEKIYIHTDSRRQLRVSVLTKSPAALNTLEIHDKWLAFGNWDLSHANGIPYSEIQLWIRNQASISTWK
ncbi:MAG: hypothetical protein U5O16_14035 [Rhodococcus sp. (in: high G+C Gram-positive bacteria)]|uniref:hypothetical protein n=1 Tax=Rhodococcus sp. TaxID=1831 RepID=UPI002AD88F46|nr:hypothetical protein [Rhodococcus sp. (in: high G+C Gram-positive bacteria)]